MGHGLLSITFARAVQSLITVVFNSSHAFLFILLILLIAKDYFWGLIVLLLNYEFQICYFMGSFLVMGL